jgi:tripartite-type tricarboxylate transporter receptor subunit TctC
MGGCDDVMNLPRRNFLQFAAGAAIPLPRLALAEDAYASRPIHVIVGFTPGASADVAARGRWTEVA